MKRIVVLVSGSGSNLQAIIDACEHKIIDGEVVAVFSNNEKAYALQRAEKHQIPWEILKDNYHNIDLYHPDCIVLAGYLKILPESFVESYENRIINIHPSLIPSFCGKGYYGKKVHKAALDYGVKITGATTHFVSALPDAGPIILQDVVHVSASDSVESLAEKVLHLEHKLLVETVKLYCDNQLIIKNRYVDIGERI